MTQKIYIKRTRTANIPTLGFGELGYVNGTGKLYIGKADGTVQDLSSTANVTFDNPEDLTASPGVPYNFQKALDETFPAAFLQTARQESGFTNPQDLFTLLSNGYGIVEGYQPIRAIQAIDSPQGTQLTVAIDSSSLSFAADSTGTNSAGLTTPALAVRLAPYGGLGILGLSASDPLNAPGGITIVPGMGISLNAMNGAVEAKLGTGLRFDNSGAIEVVGIPVDVTIVDGGEY